MWGICGEGELRYGEVAMRVSYDVGTLHCGEVGVWGFRSVGEFRCVLVAACVSCDVWK